MGRLKGQGGRRYQRSGFAALSLWPPAGRAILTRFHVQVVDENGCSSSPMGERRNDSPRNTSYDTVGLFANKQVTALGSFLLTLFEPIV